MGVRLNWLCSEIDCTDAHYAKGLCRIHYCAKRHRDQHPKSPLARWCKICGNKHHALGLCQFHYFQQYYKTNRPTVRIRNMDPPLLCDETWCWRPWYSGGSDGSPGLCSLHYNRRRKKLRCEAA